MTSRARLQHEIATLSMAVVDATARGKLEIAAFFMACIARRERLLAGDGVAREGEKI